MIKHVLYLSAVVVAMNLCACSKSILDNQDARCPFADRGGCQSMEMVNRMVEEKRYTPDGQFVQQANNIGYLRDK
ncbi:TPA: type IV conjugative transfer system protein TraV [Legionella pneumophila]|nr:type IV conjugative transfer system protein TraV [Legionella pneumophila]